MLMLLALLLQNPPPPQPRDATLEHVRRNLEREAAVLAAPPPSLPIFRVEVIERHLLLQRPWQGNEIVPPYVRTWMRLDHHEFLSAVTPEAFRSATLYPAGVPLMPALSAAQTAIARRIHSYRQARARERVRKEIDGFRTGNGLAVSAPR